mgnify:CR=1 FL=1
MKITLVTVGKIKEKYLEAAIAEYSKRLGRYCRLEIVQVADEKTPDKASELQEAQIRDKEGERILAHIKEDAYVIALAIDGKQRSSEEMAAWIGAMRCCFSRYCWRCLHRRGQRGWPRERPGGVKPCGHEDQLFAPDLSTPADARDFAGTDLPEFPDYKRRTVS